MSFLGFTRADFPFTGQTTEYLQSNYPGLGFTDTSTVPSSYDEIRNIGGALWFVTNATYDTTALTWRQVNVNLPSTAMVRSGSASGNVLSFYSAAAVGGIVSTPAITFVSAGSIRQALTQNLTVYVNASTGSDSNTGLSAASPWLTLQHARTTVQQTYDLGGSYTVTYNCTGAFTAGVAAFGPLVGQGTGTETFYFTTGSSVTGTSGGNLFLAVGNANFAVSAQSTLTLTTVGAGVIFNASDGGVVANNAAATLVLTTGAWAFETSWGGYLYNNAPTLSVSGSSAGFVYASGGLIQLAPGGGTALTVTGTPAWGTAFAWAYAGGIISTQGLTITGAATGCRFMSIGAGSGIYPNPGAALTAFPGNIAGFTNSGGIYDTIHAVAQSFVVNTTYNLATASGTQVITGFPFTPASCDAFAVVNGTAVETSTVFNAHCDSLFNQSSLQYYSGGIWNQNYFFYINTDTSGTNGAYASVTAYGTGPTQTNPSGVGTITLTWTKFGNPTGTLNFSIRAYQ